MQAPRRADCRVLPSRESSNLGAGNIPAPSYGAGFPPQRRKRQFEGDRFRDLRQVARDWRRGGERKPAAPAHMSTLGQMTEMSTEQETNVELARRAFEAFNAGDADGVLALLDPEVEIYMPN